MEKKADKKQPDKKVENQIKKFLEDLFKQIGEWFKKPPVTAQPPAQLPPATQTPPPAVAQPTPEATRPPEKKPVEQPRPVAQPPMPAAPPANKPSFDYAAV